jgi:hypothetical protein
VLGGAGVGRVSVLTREAGACEVAGVRDDAALGGGVLARGACGCVERNARRTTRGAVYRRRRDTRISSRVFRAARVQN